MSDVKRIANERIRSLFQQAEERFRSQPELSNRYVSLARRISMKTNVAIPRELKRRFCKKCLSYLKPSVNCRVRIHRNRVIYTCLNCGNIMRFQVAKQKPKKVACKNI